MKVPAKATMKRAPSEKQLEKKRAKKEETTKEEKAREDSIPTLERQDAIRSKNPDDGWTEENPMPTQDTTTKSKRAFPPILTTDDDEEEDSAEISEISKIIGPNNLSKEQLSKLATRLKSTLCQFCGRSFSRRYDLRKHFAACQCLKSFYHDHPELVPEGVVNDMNHFQEKNESQKRKRQEEKEETRISKNVNMKVLRTKLGKLEEAPLAFYPCSRCLLPLNTLIDLQAHMLATHSVIMEEEAK